MAKFPGDTSIKYSQALPSGESIAAPIIADTGAPYRALSQLGGAIFSTGAELQEQERQLQYSEGKRLIEERVNAAYETLTGDEEKDAELLKTLEKDINSIQFKDRHVNQALTIHVNNISPTIQKSFNEKHNLIRQKNVHDQFEAESQTLLANGDVVGYHDVLARRLETKDITQAEFDARMKTALGDSLLEQSRDLINSDNPADMNRGLGILSNIKQVEGLNLTTEQKEYQAKLMDYATRQQKKNVDGVAQQYWQLLQKGDYGQLQSLLNDPQSPLPITGEGGKSWWQKLLNTRLETLNQTDLETQANIADAIIFEPSSVDEFGIRDKAKLGIHGGLSLDKVEEYTNKLALMADKDSALNSPIAKTFFNELKNAQQDRVFSVEQKQNQVRYGQSLDALSDFFINYRKKHGKDPSLTEAQDYYNTLTSGYRSAQQPFTESKVQTTLGELASGGATTMFGTVIPFNKPQDAINHVIRNLGPNWQKIAPDAARIIKQKWPEADVDIQQTVIIKETFEVGDQMTRNGILYERAADGKWYTVK